MRKNQYEEALFKVEDERFEIDMVIDSNMCTIRMLEPLAEEILNMRLVEGASRAGANGGADANGNGATGSGGNGLMSNVAALGASSSNIAPRFSFQLEKRHLSTIHLNSIARIYGDHGEEILELLRRNPAGTIPVLLKRLKQKDLEWRKARTELNKHWRDVVEKNHAKSFDHRSFYFRQQDKKYMSTRQLVNEITTLANPPAVVPITTAPSSSGAAAASSSTSVSDSAAVFEDPESTGLFAKVTAEAESLLAGMSPHIVLNYENDAHLVHRDVYRVMCHAAESTLSSSADKERLAALWRDLLRVFFNVPVHYLYATGPAAVHSTTATKTGDATVDNSAMNVDTAVPLPAVPVGAYKLSASDAWPANTKVVTAYGSGEVLSFREADSMYAVKLDFGVAYMSPSSIYGSEQLSSNALFVSLHALNIQHCFYLFIHLSIAGDRRDSLGEGGRGRRNLQRPGEQLHLQLDRRHCPRPLQALLRHADVLHLPAPAPRHVRALAYRQKARSRRHHGEPQPSYWRRAPHRHRRGALQARVQLLPGPAARTSRGQPGQRAL